MDLKNILGALGKGLDFAEAALPVIKLIPGVGNVASLIETLTASVGLVQEVAHNVKERVADGTIVATSKDQAKLKEIIAKIDAQNDELNEYIVNS